MFTNFKIVAHMASPIATIDYIMLDGVLSAAIAKEQLKDDYYSGTNEYGSKELIDLWLGKILDKKQDVYCASVGIGDSREFITSWSKRWDNKQDDIVKGLKGKERIDIGAGHFKNYHMPLVVKSYRTITFYVRGNFERVRNLLENNIYYLGKKGSQGYGEILRWEFEIVNNDYSLWRDGKPMRPIPIEYCEEYIKNNIKTLRTTMKSTIPPYWRPDCREICVVP